MPIHVRLTGAPAITKEWNRKVIDQYHVKAYLACEEVGKDGAEHTHMWLDLPDDRLDTVRKWIKNNAGSTFNKSQRSVVKWDDNIRYFCKGDYVTHKVHVQITTVDPMRIKQLNELWWAVNAQVGKKKEKKPSNMVEELVVLCKENGATSREQVARTFIRSRKGLQGLCPFKHGPVIRSAWLAVNGDEEEDETVDLFLNKIWM